MDKRWYLTNVDVLSSLSGDERNYFYQKAVRKVYRKGQVIFSPGEQGNLIYYILRGRVKIYDLTTGGREIIYWFCNPNEFFGLSELCGGEARAVFAEAVEDTEVLCVSWMILEGLIRRNPEISFALIRILGARVRHSHETIQSLVAGDVRSRLALLLSKMCQICGTLCSEGIDLESKLTHQEMADMIGATRTTVTEIMNSFKKKGILKYEAGKITILTPSKLSALIDSGE